MENSIYDLIEETGLVNHNRKVYKSFSQRVPLPSLIIVKTITFDNLSEIDTTSGVICDTN